ncbi:MAG: SusC/RagA family TonB-linked outer membrane protein [Niabella sp.]
MINKLKLPVKSFYHCLIIMVCLLGVSHSLIAQQRTVKVSVTSASTKEPIPRATILVKGTNRGGTTNEQGFFTMMFKERDVLSVSAVGYAKADVVVDDNATIEVALLPADGQMEEVVVTALGIKRQEKALGYSQTTLKNEDLTNAISSNWTDALSGKVAGLNLIRSGAGPSGSNKIILRGENNLTGDNEALIVVDGVVINNSSGKRNANGSEAVYGTGGDNMPSDYGSGLNDINPEDIESVTVLKGPGAAALYGQRGANGAIIITTKASARKKKGWNITLNSNYSFEKVNRWPDLQFEYGQGMDGANYYSYKTSVDGGSTSATSSAWGPKFDGQQFYQFNPGLQNQDTIRTPWVPYTNKIRDYFETGRTFTNSVSLDGNVGKTYLRLSYTNVKNNWITPNTGYDRNSVAFSLNSKITNKLQISTKVNYTNKSSDNLPGAGYGNQSIMYWFMFWQPNADLDWLKDYWYHTNTKGDSIPNGYRIMYPYSSYPENPYAIAYEFLNAMNRDGVTGNVSATYNFNKNLSLMVRNSVDWSKEHRSQKRPYDAGANFPYGSYRTQDIQSSEVTTDFLLKYAKNFGSNWATTYSFGGSTLRNRYEMDQMRADSLKSPYAYRVDSARDTPLYIDLRPTGYKINSFYALITAAYKKFLFFDLSARQDWNSVLASPYRKGGSGFFYPALNTSFVLSDLLSMPKAINFAKFRFSLSSVGSGTTVPYRTAQGYEPVVTFVNGYNNSSRLANPNLKPLRTITTEIGANIQTFNSRLGLDFAFYLGNTKNQILERVIDRSAGFTRQVINAGNVRNTGIELALNTTPVKIGSFKWNSNMTFSANKNKIISMPDTSLVLSSGPTGSGQIVAKVGGSMGDLYGFGYVRSPDGQVVYNPSTGFAKRTETVVYVGNTIPKGKVSWGNEFTYKQIRLNFLFDAQYGAKAYSLSHYKLADLGKLTSTLPGRYSGIIGNGVIDNGDGTYRKNDVIATNIEEYYRSHWGQDNVEGNTYSTDFIKFREARLDYTIKTALLKKMGIARATFGIYGRDLFIWSPWPIFDPEFGTLSGTDIVRGFETAQFPSTRTVGFSLILGF